MASYTDIQKAVRAEKIKLWLGWVAGVGIMAVIASATRNVTVVSVITQTLLVLVFVLLTFTLFRMTSALNLKADAARQNVLKDS